MKFAVLHNRGRQTEGVLEFGTELKIWTWEWGNTTSIKSDCKRVSSGVVPIHRILYKSRTVSPKHSPCTWVSGSFSFRAIGGAEGVLRDLDPAYTGHHVFVYQKTLYKLILNYDAFRCLTTASSGSSWLFFLQYVKMTQAFMDSGLIIFAQNW